MQLFFRELGTEGQPVVILHGLFGSSDNWMTVGKQLAENHQVYLIDQRNHGQSPWSEDWDYYVMSEDLLEFVNTHQIKSPVVIGHSMGGKTAMLFAGRYYPYKADKLIVVDIAPKAYPVHHGDILTALLSLDLKSINSRKEADDLLMKSLPDFGTRQFLLKNLYRNTHNEFAWRMNLDIINRKIAEVGAAFPDNLEFDNPCLFIRGSKSDYVREEDRDLISQYFPQAKLISIEGAGHWVHAEKPDELLQVITTFIDT